MTQKEFNELENFSANDARRLANNANEELFRILLAIKNNPYFYEMKITRPLIDQTLDELRKRGFGVSAVYNEDKREPLISYYIIKW